MLRFLIFALIVVSGLIAYLGDQIGMKVGKKRLSIFGIRPRYTSIIITILTGILIASISVSLLMVASSAIRRAVFNMEKLVVDLNQLSKQVKNKDSQLKSMQKEIENKKEQLKEIREERDVTMTAKQMLQTELDRKKEKYEKTQKDYKDLVEKVASLEEQKSNLKDQKSGLETEVGNLQEMLEKMKKELATLTKRTESLTKGLMLSQLQNEQFKKQTQLYKNQDIIYRKDEIIYFESVKTDPNATTGELVKLLNNFLAGANRVVQQYDVKVDNETGNSVNVHQQDLLKVAKALTDPSYEKIILMIRADENIPVGNYINGYLEWEENYRIYKKDEVIGSKVISPGRETSVIKDKLERLLGEVKLISIEKGLSTVMRDDVGWIDLVDFYTIIDTLKEASDEMKITIKAKKDVWREDYLSGDTVEYDIRPVEE